jgi:hypothetical protein
MTLLDAFNNLIFWKKSCKYIEPINLSSLDDINSKLEEVVSDTSSISKSIISKLENKMGCIQCQISEREQ